MGDRPPLLVRARAQYQVEPGPGVWSYGSDSLAVEECVLVLSGVREPVVGIGGFPPPDARYVVKGYQRHWQVTAPPSSRE